MQLTEHDLTRNIKEAGVDFSTEKLDPLGIFFLGKLKGPGTDYYSGFVQPHVRIPECGQELGSLSSARTNL